MSKYFYRILICLSFFLATISCVKKDNDVVVSSLSLDHSSLELFVGEAFQINAKISPDNVTRINLVWSSDNDKVASVKDGTVTAKSSGKARITVEDEISGCMDFCDVDVRNIIIPVEEVQLNVSSLSLVEGEGATLIATVKPESATNATLYWSSSDPETASVDNIGQVFAIKEGKATITVKAENKTADCAVTVSAKAIPVSSVSLNKTDLTLKIGEEEVLEAIITPSDATNRDLAMWSSSDESIATVTNEGKVKAIKDGEAIISVSVDDFKAECHVHVDYVHVSDITLNETEADLYIYEQLLLEACLNPDDVTYREIEWRSSNEDVASVSASGLVTALGKGKSIISATSDGKKACCSINVLVPLGGIEFDSSGISMFPGETATMELKMNPSDATPKGDILWKSSNSSVAEVSSSGLVKAVHKGSCDISAEVDGFKAICQVSVYDSVSGITLNRNEASLNKGDSFQLTCSVHPDDAVYSGNILWTSSDSAIASVDQSGNVIALSSGTANIAAQLDAFSATCRVVVTVPVSSIILDKTECSLVKGSSVNLTATIYPTDATDKSILWESSNTSIAQVTNGKVLAKAGGEAIITAHAGDQYATCSVFVTVPVDALSIDKSSLKLKQNEVVRLIATIYPDDATDKTVVWSSSDATVVSVNSYGEVKALREGQAIISAKVGNIGATCNVTVSNQAIGGHEGTGEEDWN